MPSEKPFIHMLGRCSTFWPGDGVIHPSRQAIGICDDAQVANIAIAQQLEGVADRLYSALSAAMVQPAAADVIKATLDSSAWVWCVRFSHLRLPALQATSCFSRLCSMGSTIYIMHGIRISLRCCRVGNGFTVAAAAALQGIADLSAPLRTVPADLAQQHSELLLELGVRTACIAYCLQCQPLIQYSCNAQS
jgi:hypothetical protein